MDLSISFPPPEHGYNNVVEALLLVAAQFPFTQMLSPCFIVPIPRTLPCPFRISSADLDTPPSHIKKHRPQPFPRDSGGLHVIIIEG